MKRLNTMSAAIAEADRLDAEADAAIAFFGAMRRLRAETAWPRRERRRNRARRAAQYL